MRTTFCIGTVVILSLFLICISYNKSNAGDDIVGKWTFKEVMIGGRTDLDATKQVLRFYQGRRMTIDFYPNHTCLLSAPTMMGETQKSKDSWVRLDNSRIKIIEKGKPSDIIFIKGNQLLIKEGDYTTVLQKE
jgi:hypothetical protein